MDSSNEGKCPFNHGQENQKTLGGTTNQDWWPSRLNLNILRQHSSLVNPSEYNIACAAPASGLEVIICEYLFKILKYLTDINNK